MPFTPHLAPHCPQAHEKIKRERKRAADWDAVAGWCVCVGPTVFAIAVFYGFGK